MQSAFDNSVQLFQFVDNNIKPLSMIYYFTFIMTILLLKG